MYADSPVLNYSDDRVRQALTVGLATLIGGAAGALLGTDATSAALAAQNESLNNATSGQKKPGTPDEIRKMLEQERRAFGQTGSVPNSGGSNGPAMVGPSPLALGGAKGGAPNFIVSPNGVAYPVPNGATGPELANNGRGMQFQGGAGGNGLSPNTTGFRFMDPIATGPYPYPYGYGSYNNSSGQAVNPLTGKTIPKTDPMWHIPGK